MTSQPLWKLPIASTRSRTWPVGLYSVDVGPLQLLGFGGGAFGVVAAQNVGEHHDPGTRRLGWMPFGWVVFGDHM